MNHTRESLEETLSVLYRATNDFNEYFKERLAPVISFYRVAYRNLTGQEYQAPKIEKQKSSKPPIYPKVRIQQGTPLEHLHD